MLFRDEMVGMSKTYTSFMVWEKSIFISTSWSSDLHRHVQISPQHMNTDVHFMNVTFANKQFLPHPRG
jgi:hypothetical protein